MTDIIETDSFIELTGGGTSITIPKTEQTYTFIDAHLRMGVLELGEEVYAGQEVFFEGETVIIEELPVYTQYTIQSQEDEYTEVTSEDGSLVINTEVLGKGDYTISELDIQFTVESPTNYTDPEQHIVNRLLEAINQEEITIEGYTSSEAIEIYYDDDTPQQLRNIINQVGMIEPERMGISI